MPGFRPVRSHSNAMKNFTVAICLTVCLAAVLALPAKDEALDKQWNEHKDSIMDRLTKFDENLKKQLAETEGKVKTAKGDEKKGLEERIEVLKKEIEKSKSVIDKLKSV